MRKETKKHVAIYQLCPPLVFCFLGWAVISGVLFLVEEKIGPVCLNYVYGWREANRMLYTFIGLTCLSGTGMVAAGILYSTAVTKDAGRLRAFKENNSYGEKPLFAMMMPKDMAERKVKFRTVGESAETFALKYHLPVYNIGRIFRRGILVILVMHIGICGPVLHAALKERNADVERIAETCEKVDVSLKEAGFVPCFSKKARRRDIKKTYQNNGIWSYRSGYRHKDFKNANRLRVLIDRTGTVRGVYMTFEEEKNLTRRQNLERFSTYLDVSRAGLKSVKAPGKFSAFLIPRMNRAFADAYENMESEEKISLRMDTNVKKEMAYKAGQFICWMED